VVEVVRRGSVVEVRGVYNFSREDVDVQSCHRGQNSV
jgi:hypothetical protein